jgi:hypothetical protein
MTSRLLGQQPHPPFGVLVCFTSTQNFTSTQKLKLFALFLTTIIMNSYSEIENRITKACEAAKRVENLNISI